MRGTLLLSLVFFGACGPKAPPTPAEPLTTEPVVVVRQVADLLAEAVDILSTDESNSGTQRALGILEELVGRAPEDALVQFNYGVANHRAGELDAATRAYEAAIGRDGSLGVAWLHLGRVQAERGNFGGAMSSYRTGIKSDPEDMNLRVGLIDALRDSGDLDGAVAAARESLRVNATSVAVYNSMGLTYIDKGDLLLARFVFQKAMGAIEGASDNAYLNANLGRTYFLEGEIALATNYLEKARELQPDLVPALVYLAEIYLADHNYEDTVGLLEAAAEASPDNHGVQMRLGIAYRGVGRLDEAKAAYQRALQIEVNNPDPHFNLGILLGDYAKEYDDSIASFESYLDRGGSERERAEAYIKSVSKEQKRAEKRKTADAERKKREEERAERQRLLEEAEKKKAEEEASQPPPEEATQPSPQEGPPGNDAPPAEQPAPPPGEEAPAPEGAEAPAEDASPWGDGQPEETGGEQ
jgi:tetratricopeptide (TPR) repeat protein